jgi:hypothetical protein
LHRYVNNFRTPRLRLQETQARYSEGNGEVSNFSAVFSDFLEYEVLKMC